MKYACIQEHQGLTIARKCAIMGVSRSGFYDWRNREVSVREVSNIQLDEHIMRIYREHEGRYGYRRVCVLVKT